MPKPHLGTILNLDGQHWAEKGFSLGMGTYTYKAVIWSLMWKEMIRVARVGDETGLLLDGHSHHILRLCLD